MNSRPTLSTSLVHSPLSDLGFFGFGCEAPAAAVAVAGRLLDDFFWVMRFFVFGCEAPAAEAPVPVAGRLLDEFFLVLPGGMFVVLNGQVALSNDFMGVVWHCFGWLTVEGHGMEKRNDPKRFSDSIQNCVVLEYRGIKPSKDSFCARA